MKQLAFLLVILLAVICHAAEISPLLVPVDRSARAGTNADFWLVYLNSGSTPSTVHIPAQLPVTLESAPHLSFHQMLVRQDKQSVRTIEPGGFCRISFATPIPANVTGPVTVEINQPGATPVIVIATSRPVEDSSRLAPAQAKAQSSPATSPSTARIDKAQREPATTNQWISHDPLTEAFAGRFSTYQPTYFIAGSRPTAKIQISLKYKLFDDEGSLAEKYGLLDHLYLAYTQTSFWDWVSPSTPFTDNSYRPELMFSYDDILPNNSSLWDLSQLGLQGGFQHESNGRDGLASRSMNLIYIRPIFVWDIDKTHDIFLSVAPRVFAYVTDLSDNPDIAQYRGYGDIRLVFGQRYGPQLSMFARVGEDFNKGSLELDLSQPLRGRSKGNLDLYLYGQFFTGYGEQLIQYNKSTTTFRIGLAFVR